MPLFPGPNTNHNFFFFFRVVAFIFFHFSSSGSGYLTSPVPHTLAWCWLRYHYRIRGSVGMWENNNIRLGEKKEFLCILSYLSVTTTLRDSLHIFMYYDNSRQKIKWFIQGYICDKWKNWNFKTRPSYVDSIFFPIRCTHTQCWGLYRYWCISPLGPSFHEFLPQSSFGKSVRQLWKPNSFFQKCFKGIAICL